MSESARLERVPPPSALARISARLPGLPEVGAVAALVLAWEVLGRALDFAFLPTASEVAARAVGLLERPNFVGDLLTTGLHFAVGYGSAVTVGIVLGMLMGRFKLVAIALEPYVNILLVTPTLILAPLLFMLFGLGAVTLVIVVFLYVFPIVTVNTMAGVQRIDPSLLEMADVFGLSERQVLFKILLPSGLPLVMAGLRLGVSRAVKGSVNGEMLVALVGLGGAIRTFGGSFDAAGVLAVLLWVLVFALVVSYAVRALDTRVVWWADASRPASRRRPSRPRA